LPGDRRENAAVTLVGVVFAGRQPGRKGRFAMFFKIIAAAMASIIGYFVIANDFDYGKTVSFGMLPLTTIIAYVVLGAD
jgi:hypothetical protein